MKYQKLLLGAAAVCLLVGASGVAEAANCSSGFIINQTVSNVTIQGKSCVIIGSTVAGNIIVTNSAYVAIIGSAVSGGIKVENSEGITNSTSRVTGRGILLRNSKNLAVYDNEVPGGSIWVYGNRKVNLKKNNAGRNILCNHKLLCPTKICYRAILAAMRRYEEWPRNLEDLDSPNQKRRV